MNVTSKIKYNPKLFSEMKDIACSSFKTNASELFRDASDDIEKFIIPRAGLKTTAKNLLESLVHPVLGFPRDIFESSLKKLDGKFPRSKILAKISHWKPLINYRNTKDAKKAERILRGMYGKFHEMASKNSAGLPGGANQISNASSVTAHGISMLDMLNNNARVGVAKYNTRDGEGLKRLVTALIPIPFLFRDSFYISKKNNMSDEEARKQAQNKANQELIAAGGESLSQFTILGGMPTFINSSQIAAPLINTAIGLTFHVVSRLRTGRKLTHLTKDEVAKRVESQQIQDFNNFQKYAKTRENLSTQEPKKDGKKRLLSAKNLLLFAATSVVAGFGLAKGKDKFLNYVHSQNNENKLLSKAFKTITEKYKNLTTEENIAVTKHLREMSSALKDICGADLVDEKFKCVLNDASKNGGKISLGVTDKVVKIPLVDVRIPVKKLIELPFVPFRIMFEIAGYPYKAVKTLTQQLGSKSDQTAKAGKLATDKAKKGLRKLGELTYKAEKPCVDKYNIANFYNEYADLFEKNRGNVVKTKKAFKEFFSKNFSRTFDMERSSKIDNSKIGKLTQLLGMVGGIYFATNDDYNQTLLETGSVRKAQVDQRRRGVQKFTRVTTGVAISDWFNQVFVRNYNNSLFGALAVVAASTFAVDTATRFILGQPAKNLTPEQLEKFEKQKETGFMAPFYNFMDKLAH